MLVAVSLFSIMDRQTYKFIIMNLFGKIGKEKIPPKPRKGTLRSLFDR
jgi:hypothetical protein